MKNFVELSSLPRVAGSIIIGSKYAKILKKPLEKIGILPLLVPENPNVDPRLSGHADLSVFHAGGKRLYLAQHLKDTDFAEKLSRLGAELEFPEFHQKREYPSDAYLNARAVGKKLIYGKNVTAGFIVKCFTNHSDVVLIGSRQGYAGCSVCVVDENSIITADAGIAKAAVKHGIDVLCIENGHIDLPGFEYGFIGGSSFKLSKDELAFTGVLDEHPDKKEIMSFLASKSVEPVFLTDRKIFDIGGGIPLIEE